ncbi:migration and invasion-inhibitory protein [Silurus meridionalis]|uniref:Migration and invasion inhibitory protein n=1 Tax=Silurus meridionalis TaxID=175797 RepID=A0A8T0AK45_SILME|nr:migration and invasion-inhibitory protein [Silurus meridionalis]KAF7693082.1 hypothetical protein HF521_008398 [Silurus meridionalis]
MASFEDLEILRRKNKELLQKLKDRTEHLQRLHSHRPDFQRDEKAKWQHASSDVLLQARGKSRLHVRFHPEPTMQPRSSIAQDTGQSQVKLPPGDAELGRVSERRCVQPLLGYDWIAGLLDAENSLTEHSEHFFSELQTFRQVNKDECVHSASSWTEGLHVGLLESSLEDGVTNHKQTPDTHQCTFCYRINNRLFATPLDAQAACPVCKTPIEKHPHREKEPAFIRVSIPRATLLPAYRYKAHRRCSFDPSDSLGLPSHCLSGWTNISMGAGSEMSSLDLRSSMEIRPNPKTVPSAKLDRSGSRASGRQLSDQLLHVSRLAQYQIQRNAVTRRNPNMSSC